MPHHVEFSTQVRASAREAWAWISSVEGITKEMHPYLSMTTPADLSHLTIDTVIPGQCLFRSWIKFFGVVPFDFSDLTLLHIDEGVGFVEQSPIGSMRLWRHERHPC